MLRSKLPESAKTALKDLTKLAHADGCIDLMTTIPDCDMPEPLKKRLIAHFDGGCCRYAPLEGFPQLRRTMARYYEKNFGHRYNPETELTITAGSSPAVWAAITALIHEDDEVIIMEPAHSNYVPAVKINGGTPIFVTLKYPEYQVDWSELNRMINQRTKMIIVNSPHIPSGRIFTDEDFRNLQKIVVGNKIVVLVDETLSTTTYEKPYISAAKYPSLAKQTIIISSLSKSFNATGWKTGICAAPADFTKEIRRMHTYICNGSNPIAQLAINDLLSQEEELLFKIRDTYKAKRDLLCSLLKGSQYQLVPAEGSWYQLVDFSAISKDSDRDFCLKLAKDFGVAAFPMSAYYHDKTKTSVIRICFARPDDTIREGAKRMLNYK
ncbi:MAG: aminotransferase class I/II-fold pyridoxal phosphate-dependent enzyme [Bacteroidales bacterium]|nr:aminotransferase class I/II-fold pyridoxal phosphate-dependent enzyme [Bacteroidales bacterium]